MENQFKTRKNLLIFSSPSPATFEYLDHLNALTTVIEFADNRCYKVELRAGTKNVPFSMDAEFEILIPYTHFSVGQYYKFFLTGQVVIYQFFRCLKDILVTGHSPETGGYSILFNI